MDSNRDSSLNPDFSNYTLVEILYCSGDVHGGNASRSYGAVQTGAENTAAVLNWIKRQNLSLDDLIITGCSAGSVGAQIWAEYILSNFHAKSSAVIPDSFVGVFPPGSQVRQSHINHTKIAGLLAIDIECQCSRAL